MKTKIDYDGAYPNLCSGNLTVTIDEIVYKFPNHCLISGGSVSFTEDWNEVVTDGPWEISEWPEGFLEEYKCAVLNEVNHIIPWGCCGGCV